jgi:hypothetical protein
VSDVRLGTVPDSEGVDVSVWLNGDGTVSLIVETDDDDDYRAVTFAPGGLDEVRELLDRAAMPGQVT